MNESLYKKNVAEISQFKLTVMTTIYINVTAEETGSRQKF